MLTTLWTRYHGKKAKAAASGRQRKGVEKTVTLTVLMVLLLTFYGCRSSPLADKKWTQFHADGPNTGFIAIQSTDARQPLWTVTLGGTVYSSPAVAEDGTIYVGTLNGNLVAVNPNGTIKWKIPFSSSAILSSPAVGEDGNIYVVLCVQMQNEERPRAMLMSLAPDSQILWLYHFPRGSTTSSPKPWTNEDGRTYVFLPVQFSTDKFPDALEEGYSELFVFDQEGNPINRKAIGGCVSVRGGSGPNWLGDLWDAITSIGEPGVITGGPLPIHEQYGWLDATVAVVDFPNVAPRGTPIIVVSDSCSGLRLTGLRWTPFGLLRLWTYEKKSGTIWHSSPAVFPNGLLVLGSLEGKVMGFDAATGSKLWETDIDQVVMATPVSALGRPIYVVSRTHLHMIEPNGEKIKEIALFSQTLASPVLTADRVYVSSWRGLHSYSLDLTSFSIDEPIAGGLSSPAVSKDGVLYMVSIDGQLRAYAIQ